MTFEITIYAKTPARLARFWAAAIPGYQVRPYDQAEIDRLAGLGLTPETDTSVPIDAAGKPTIWFQQNDSVAVGRNRIHFDLAFTERREESARLVALGATIQSIRADHIVMLDPEGNQFCLFDPRQN